MKIQRTVLRYHGGKFYLARWIISHFPKHRIYVEPYCGGASVLMQKSPSEMEIINDLNGEIVNLFRVLRDPGQASLLEDQVRLTPFARAEFDAAFCPSSDPIEGARRTLIKSLMSMGTDSLSTKSGFRINGFRHSGATPITDWSNYSCHIQRFTDRLRRVGIENKPALEVMLQQDREDCLFYVDPPYVHETRTSRGSRGYVHEMTEEEHREMAAVLQGLQGMVILSGYNCPLYEELFGDWKRIDRQTMADGANLRTESLWMPFSVAAKTQGILEMEEESL